jgi:ABC-type transporter Mla subunit MlaD
MAFASDNDIRLKVTLDEQDALRAAESLKTKITETTDNIAKEFKKAEESVKKFSAGLSGSIEGALTSVANISGTLQSSLSGIRDEFKSASSSRRLKGMSPSSGSESRP